MMSSTSGVDVVLVARERVGEENLGIRYVAAALERAGHRPRLVTLWGPATLAQAARSVLDAGAPLVGLGISDGAAALDQLVLGRLLRRHGFSGHITAGGALATLARHELLERQPALDSIVRHDGERPVVELARRLAAGLAWADVPGLTTRAGDGVPAAPGVDAGHAELRPVRPSPLHRILGVPGARIVGSRGCLGNCGYCASVPLRRDAVEQARRAGLSEEAVARANTAGRRRRAPGDLAREVSSLYHDQGARWFQVIDDNLVGGDAGDSEAWLRQLVAELRARGVRKTAWSLMIDPDSVTASMLDVFDTLGVVRVLVGIESLTEAGLRALGRPGTPERNRRAIERLVGRGIATLFNSIAVHPTADARILDAELGALAKVDGAYFELSSLVAYSKTDLLRRLCRTGRATGGLFGYRYDIEDPIVTRFAALLPRLSESGNRAYDIGRYAHEVAANLAMARHLGLPAYHRDLQRRVTGLVRRINACRLRAWRSALALSSTELSLVDRGTAVKSLTDSLGHELTLLGQEVERVHEAMCRRSGVKLDRKSFPLHSTVAAGFFVTLAATACGGDTEANPSSGGGGTSAVSVGTGGAPPGTGGAPSATAGAGAESSGGAQDAGLDAGEIQHLDCPIYDEQGQVIDFDWSFEKPVASGPPACDDARVCEQVAGVRSPWVQHDCRGACYSGERWGIAVDANGKVVDVLGSDRATVTEEIRQCALDALRNETFPCLSGGEIWQVCPVLMLI